MTGKFNINILVAPLDWGLGHATRCIPLVAHLLSLHCNVIIAAEGAQARLLELEFPQLKIVPLKGYRISYSKKGWLFPFKVVMQVPKILSAISGEKKWLDQFLKSNEIAAIISDNRYGLYTKRIPCVFITHQLAILTGLKGVDRLIQWINYRFIRRFTACWVPDYQNYPGMAGRLSHPQKYPGLPLEYLGGISRMTKGTAMDYQYKALILLSGPEPQRSLLEEKVLSSIGDAPGKFFIARGLPGHGAERTVSNTNVVIKNHLAASELAKVMSLSEFVISRSGYTTVMDVLQLAKKAIVVPTPGQTEQEHLAQNLEQQQWAVTASQHNFSVSSALSRAEKFIYHLPELTMEDFKPVVEAWVVGLKKEQKKAG